MFHQPSRASPRTWSPEGSLTSNSWGILWEMGLNRNQYGSHSATHTWTDLAEVSSSPSSRGDNVQGFYCRVSRYVSTKYSDCLPPRIPSSATPIATDKFTPASQPSRSLRKSAQTRCQTCSRGLFPVGIADDTCSVGWCGGTLTPDQPPFFSVTLDGQPSNLVLMLILRVFYRTCCMI